MPVFNTKPKNDSINDDEANYNNMTPTQSNLLQSTTNNDKSSSAPSSSPVDTRGCSNIVSFSGSSNSGHSIVIDNLPSTSRMHSASTISCGSTPSNSSGTMSGRSRHQKQSRQQDHKKGRSRALKGATNLAKETKLLRRRIDSVLSTFEETVVSASQSKNIKLESLHAENRQLQAEIRELEIETFKQAAELEDSDELMVQMEERRLASKQEVTVLKKKCYSLAKEVVFLKKSLDAYEQTDKAQLAIENEKLECENESLKLELSAKDKTIRDLGNQLHATKMKVINDKENNEESCNTGCNTNIERAGNGEPKFAFGKKKDDVNANEGTLSERFVKTPKGKHRRSSHSIALRGSHKKKFQF